MKIKGGIFQAIVDPHTRIDILSLIALHDNNLKTKPKKKKS